MILWLAYRRKLLWLIPILLILDWLIAPVLVAWELNLIRNLLDN